MRPWIIAGGAFLAALLITLVLPFLRAAPYLPFVAAVLIAARYGGQAPAILTAIVSFVAFELLSNEPTGLTAGFAARAFAYALISVLCIGWASHTAHTRREVALQGERLRALEDELSAQQKSVEASRATETRFERFMQHLPGLAWVKDLEGRYIYVNHPDTEPFKLPASEVPGRTDHEIFPAALAARFIETDRKALASDNGTILIDSLEQDDGVLHYSIVSKFPIPGPDGAPLHVGGMAIDITEQKRAEELLQKIIDTIPVMISIHEPNTNVVRLNREFTRVLGWSTQEAAGQSLMRACYPDSVYRQRVIEFMQSCRPGWMDSTMTTRHGRQIETSWANIRVSDNTQVGIGIDITDRKRTEEALLEADRRKDEFLATLSHELRNPLAPLYAGLETLRQISGHGQDADRVLEIVERQVQQLARLVDDLLDFSRIATGKIELRRQRIPLSVVVNEAIESSRSQLEAARHTLTVSLPSEEVLLYADRTRLAQVLMNLLNNAAKFTEPGGGIAVQAWRDGNSVLLSVRDSGSGIPADKLAYIFEMFAQVDRSLERARSGLGIGLSLVRALVEMHGGTVAARSEGPGRGSEFIVRLPVPSDALQMRERRGQGLRDSGPVDMEGRRILVVDDNEDAADSLALLLSAMGCETRAAYDGRSALETASEFRPSLILLDIGMPDMNGYEVARGLRQKADLADTVLVALTGWGQNEDRRRSREAGFHYHLVKPVDGATLRDLLRNL